MAVAQLLFLGVGAVAVESFQDFDTWSENAAGTVNAPSGTTMSLESSSLQQPFSVSTTEAAGQTSDHVQAAIRAGQVKSRGVNLAGWLVAEHWITKDAEIWHNLSEEDASSGEFIAMQRSPREVAVQRFEGHWKSFITEDDIAQIASAGLNTVRVPVGYWIAGFDNHDVSNEAEWKMHAPGGLKYLDRLVREWARTHNVSVLISMHAAKGSQNGAEHSSPAVKDRSLWSLYPENIATTVDAVRFLAQRYRGDDAFLGIGLLNEPDGTTTTKALYQYYEDAYRLIRIEDQNDCILTVSPLLTEQSANFDLRELLPGASNVWVEWHRYFTRGLEDATEDELLTSAIPKFQTELDSWKDKSDKKLFVGAFSFATAKQQFIDTQHRLNEFAQAQLELLSNHVDAGWTFWTWRVLGGDDDISGGELSRWSLRSMIRNGVFPALA